ncbi:hypothetical protein ACFW1A_36615 [Kitasatospora sp. NPDC058965]|uniref:hypothetical protein n=1 Tax=Kitasatospora sp. NPDC058965 TaxID=3346682 RepID=UPI003684B15F
MTDRQLSPAVPLLAAAVAVVSLLTGAAMAAAALTGHAFGAWRSADPLDPGLVGAAMVGVAPGLLLVGRARSWREVRTLVLPTAVVLLGLLAVTLANPHQLHAARGGSIVLVLFSLGWILVLGLLAAAALGVLLHQYLAPARPATAPDRTAPLPAWSKPLLAVLGSAWFGLGAGLLALPGFWGAFVPWPVDRPDAQALGVWCLALGTGTLGALVEDDLTRLRPALLALPGTALAAAGLLAGRAGHVHWRSGPGLALPALLAGLLVAGLTGRALLRRADRATAGAA